MTALNHERPDRCPMQVSFTPEFAKRVKDYLGQAIRKTHNPHGGGNTYQLERHLDEDILVTSVGWANSYYQSLEPGFEYTDDWGIGWRVCKYETSFGTGVYTEISDHPLSEDSAVETYKTPDPEEADLYLDAENLIANFKDEYCVVGATVTTVWETAWALRGLEKLMLDCIINPELADRILDFPFRYHLAAAKKLVEMGVDIIWIGDDVGAQNSMLISPDMWRRFLKTRMETFIREIKSINPDLKVAYHSDGDIYPIIPELIEIGVDILNPVQPASMDPARIKKEFGKNLCFWGTIDEQHTLPFGSAKDVADEVKLRLQTVGKDGGLIIGPTHHVQLDTPMENFWAMIDTIKAGY